MYLQDAVYLQGWCRYLASARNALGNIYFDCVQAQTRFKHSLPLKALPRSFSGRRVLWRHINSSSKTQWQLPQLTSCIANVSKRSLIW